MFDIDTSKSIDEGKLSLYSKKFSGSIEFIGRTRENNGVKGYVERLENVMPNTKDVISVSQVGTITAQIRNSIWYASQNIFILKPRQDKKLVCCGILTAINVTLRGNFCDGYSKYPTLKTLKNLCIQLPIKNGKIDFEFMEQFVAELETRQLAELEARQLAELDSYLKVTGLKDYYLTKQEEQALQDFDKLEWGEFNLKSLFGSSTRGKRLKSDDRISGNLPFVTAGEADEGISAFISNDVEIFSDNTTTIDMFGSAKYRCYKYGADDHVAVVHTEKLDKNAAIFVTSAIHKSSHNGQFDYGRNFYAKDADCLDIMLPIDNDGGIDYMEMSIIISAIQKLVIKDVVLYNESRLKATEKVIGHA